MVFGLERMHATLRALGAPQETFDAIHVVGTNGKSSTVRMAEALLVAEGLRTGAYLSPHVEEWRERIRVGGEPAGPDAFARALLAVRDVAGDGVTQFEALTAAAFAAFRDAGVEWAVVEAGLGGRLDATNVLPRARVAVLTNVALDHTDLLGDTRDAIAAEKLAVARPGMTLVVGEPEWGERAPAGVAVRVAAGGATAADQNRLVARAAVEAALGRPVDPAPMEAVSLPGRLEVRGGRPLEVWDGAHNPAGMERLAREIGAVVGDRPVVAVFAALADKDVGAMAAALRTVAGQVIATSLSNPRAMDADELARICGGVAIADPAAALAAARARAGRDGAVLVCGSLYLLHELHAG